MCKIVLSLLFLAVHMSSTINAQSTAFSLDSASLCYFYKEHIYFHHNKSLIKSDYSGNISWKKQSDPITQYSSFCFTDNAIYGWSDTIVFKLDTSGNLLWEKGFGALAYPIFNASQYVSNVTSTASRVFVTLETFSFGTEYYTAYIALDTSGTIQNSWGYSQGSTPISNPVTDGIPSADGNGAWLASLYKSGISTSPLVTRVDNSGQANVQDSVVTTFGSSGGVQIFKLLVLPDSTYVIASNHGLSNGQQDIKVVRFNDHGEILGKFIFSSIHTYLGLTLCEGLGLAADSAGYLYLVGNFMDSPTSLSTRPVVIKLDLLGNIIWLKSWSDAILNSTPVLLSHMNFKNDSIYYFCTENGKKGIIAFDTSMTGNCFIPDSTMPISMVAFGTSSTGSNPFYPFSYTSTSVTGSPTSSIQAPVVTSFCGPVFIQDQSAHEKLIIFPDPITQHLLQFEYPADNDASLSIFSLDGKEVEMLTLENGKNSYRVNLPNLPPGIYLARITTLTHTAISKFVHH